MNCSEIVTIHNLIQNNLTFNEIKLIAIGKTDQMN